MFTSLPLSALSASRTNLRRVRPEREAHRKLVASIRAHGLLEPLVVRPLEDDRYLVIAGHRRLAALRDVHRGEDAEIPCMVQQVDADTAASMSLAENFAREPMHPLDEAEAFARLASLECKGVKAIAEEFGVTEHYVRQRMKLASLHDLIKTALRRGEISIGIAEAFAAVPADRQFSLWEEMGGHPRHAQHVRNLIEHQWIPATHALFDVDKVDPAAASHDLFGGDVLVERSVFLAAQAEALTAERTRLTEDGWKEVVIGLQEEVQDRLYSMDTPQPEYEPAVESILSDFAASRARLEAVEPADEDEAEKLNADLDELDKKEGEFLDGIESRYGEATKAAGTVFMLVYPDGRVEYQHRVPRSAPERRGLRRTEAGRAELNGHPDSSLPTSNQLSDRQRTEVHFHEAVAVREAIAANRIVRKRLIVLALHDKVCPYALAVRHSGNGTTLHGQNSESVRSILFDGQQSRRRELDPLTDEHPTEETDAYERTKGLTEAELEALIDVLTVEVISGHAQRETPLVTALRDELGVSVREHWTPSGAWLAGYQKAQLAHLIGELKGPAHGSAALRRKKSELVEELAALFSQAAEAGTGFDDAALADRVNAWLPASPRDEAPGRSENGRCCS